MKREIIRNALAAFLIPGANTAKKTAKAGVQHSRGDNWTKSAAISLALFFIAVFAAGEVITAVKPD